MSSEETRDHQSNHLETDHHLSSVHLDIIRLIADCLDQADIKCLLLTCRRLASDLQPIIVRRDIDDRMYNSLSWACYFGDTSLGQFCLEMGASPNASFFLDGSRGLPFEGKRYYRDAYEARLHHDEFEFPVYPTKKISGVPILYGSECASCSALALATKRDHVDMVKLLLNHGADVIEKRRKAPDSAEYYMAHPSLRYEYTSLFSHESIISHVRSVKVAEALLAVGSNEHINYAGNTGYTPLEMLLSSCSEYRKSWQPDLTEPELYAITRLFLENGARTIRVNLHAGSLLAAIATGYMSVVQLVLAYTSLDFSTDAADHKTAMLLAIGDNRVVFDENDPFTTSIQARLLGLLLDAGLSPNQSIPSREPLLNIAILRQNHRSAQLLLDRKADTNFTNYTALSPLSRAIYVCAAPVDVESEFIVPLIRAGADIDQPSFWTGGFTPLMIATADLIPSRIFENLIQFGADIGVFRRISPNGPLISVLHCLLVGFPNVEFEWEDADTRELLLQNDLGQIRIHEEVEVEVDSIWEFRRKSKFENFVKHSPTPSHFHTHSGEHLLNWAVKNLYHYNLEWAVEMLLPHYFQTKLRSDTESPLWTLFSSLRVEKYLAFGTLYQTLRISEAMIENGITATEKSTGETILHRVCRLYQGVPDHNFLKIATSLGQKLDFGQDLSNDAASWIEQLHAKDVPRFTSTTSSWRRVPKKMHLSRYMACRLRIIALMIELFMKQGVDLYAEDDKGRTAYEEIEAEQVLNWIPEELRDLKKEAKIQERRKANLGGET